jgi:hypothetical protein
MWLYTRRAVAEAGDAAAVAAPPAARRTRRRTGPPSGQRSGMREIVSLQLGRYANYVGAHFWNLQDEALAQAPDAAGAELSPHVFFRTANERNAVLPYAPRLQVVDLTGAFGCLSVDTGVVRTSQAVGADGDGESSALWGGRSQRVVREAEPVNRYLLSLEEGAEDAMNIDAGAGQRGQEQGDDGATGDLGLDWNVKYWSDFVKVRFHPRTGFALPGVHAGVQPFASFDDGASAASSETLDDAYNDLRFFVEECESLGGLSVTCDASGGFAGFGEKYLAALRDELGSSLPMVAFGATTLPEPRGDTDAATLQRVLAEGRLNESTLVSALADISVQYVPLRAQATQGMPLVYPAISCPFQTSAVLGAAVDLALTPLRHRQSPMSMASWAHSLRPAPCALLSGLCASLPVLEPVSFAHSAVVEVPGMTRLSTPFATPASRSAPTGAAAKARSARLAGELVIGRGVSGTFESACRTRARVAVPVPYPRFFDGRLGLDGRLKPTRHTEAGGGAERPALSEVGELSALAAVYTDAAEGGLALRAYSGALSRASKRASQGQGLTEPATQAEAAEALLSLCNDYETKL